MIHSCRQTISAIIVVTLISSACARAEELPQQTTTAQTQAVAAAATENPFTRTSLEPKMPRCATMSLQAREGSMLSALRVENECNYAIAVLTSPIEVRVRLTGKEKFTNERMPWTAYGLLYVVSAELGKGAFDGDGVIRDGGWRVNREPAYVTVPPKSEVVVPINCALDLTPGRYAVTFMTYEAPQGDAPPHSDAFDCAASVERYNAGVESARHVSLGGDVHEVQTTSTIEVPRLP